MDHFSSFIQMLHAKKLSPNTILVYISYIKPYLTYLDGIQILPVLASYQSMRDFLDAIQSERHLSDRTMDMIISYLQFFQTYVLHKNRDKTQLPFCALDTFLPYSHPPTEVKRFLLVLEKPKAALQFFPQMLYGYASGTLGQSKISWYGTRHHSGASHMEPGAFLSHPYP